MHEIFINYRSAELSSATLVERELSQQFGSDRVFRASKSIQAGENFEHTLLRAVRRSAVLIAVIGPRWLERDEQGHRALDDKNNWTRREILEALECGITVIPLLIADAPRLHKNDLPPAMRQLGTCQHRRLDLREVEPGIARLTNDLIELVPELREAKATRSGEQPRGSGDAGSPTVHGNFFNASVDAEHIAGRDVNLYREVDRERDSR